MAKKIGLAAHHTKLFKIEKLDLSNLKTQGCFLYSSAKNFFYIAHNAFQSSYMQESGTLTYRFNQIGPILHNLHLSYEQYLKAIIYMHNGFDLEEDPKTHNLTELLKLATTKDNQLEAIRIKKQAQLLLEELTANFTTIRYGEGYICFRDNNERGHKNKIQLEEFIETVTFIQEKFEESWERSCSGT